MRVNGRSRTVERGVAAPLLAVFLVVLLGLAAMVIDYGSLWQHRRQMVTATDAAALAAAQEYAIGGNGCDASVARAYYDRNAPANADAPACTPGTQQVRVDGSVTVEYGFGRILGLDSQAIVSSTTASWQQPSSVKGLRPLGLCLSVLRRLNASPPRSGQRVTIPWNNSQPDDCSTAGNNIPGGWGYIDFNGGGNGGNEIEAWTADGYDQPVSPGVYEPFTGSHSNLQSTIEGLISDGQCVALPVYERASGNGNNIRYRVVDFATVVFTGVRFTGSPNNRFLSFQFTPCVVQGDGTNGGGVDYFPRVIRICRVDSTTTNDCP
jgi:hypothetical protein